MIAYEVSNCGAETQVSLIENNKKVGASKFVTEGFFCNITDISFDSDKLYVFQALIRKCCIIASESGALMVKITDKNVFDSVKSMNFIFDGTNYSNDIPSVLMNFDFSDDVLSTVDLNGNI